MTQKTIRLENPVKASSINNVKVNGRWEIQEFVKIYSFTLAKTLQIQRQGGGGVKKYDFSVTSLMDEA